MGNLFVSNLIDCCLSCCKYFRCRRFVTSFDRFTYCLNGSAELRTSIKAVRKAIETGDKASAAKVFAATQATIDKITDKKIAHKNTASRQKSRLSAAIKAMAA